MKSNSVQDVLSKVIDKAWDNPSFKQELIKNPLEAIESATGERLNIPSGKKLVVIDQTNTEIIYLTIPPEPNLDDMELTDEQLELVAGGSDPLEVAKAAGKSSVIYPDPNAWGGP